MIDNDAVHRPYTRPANTAETYQGGPAGATPTAGHPSPAACVCVSVCVCMCVRERAGERAGERETSSRRVLTMVRASGMRACVWACGWACVQRICMEFLLLACLASPVLPHLHGFARAVAATAATGH